MPQIIPKGLKGLRGFSSLSDYEKDTFMHKYANVLNEFKNPMNKRKAAEILYNNQNFIQHYGIDAFNKMNDDSTASYEYRNNLLKNDVVNTEFTKWGSPFKADGTRDNNKGLGAEWEKYNQLSPDAKLKLMESGYQTSSEFEKTHPRKLSAGELISKALGDGIIGKTANFILNQTSIVNPIAGSDSAFTMAQEGLRQHLREKNDKILQDIYNEDIDKAKDRLSDQVASAYYSPQIANLTDDQVKKAFIKASYGDRSKGDIGIPEYASHYGNGTPNDISAEMKDFSIDDMRQVLAKRMVYYANMSPEMASTALNNEAKRYITERQSIAKKIGLLSLDIGIASMSYTADKVNSIGELGRTVQDLTMDTPVVMVDDKGEVIDPNKTHVAKGKNGGLYYQDKQGNIHSVHKEQVSRSALHQMGKNSDGSDIEGAFGTDWLTTNPQYWTRAEQFKTLDADAQKQYEKRGSSPYQVSYNPGDDSDLVYESLKMASFHVADKFLEFAPYGIGKIGKGISSLSKLGKVAEGFGKILQKTGNVLSQNSKSGQIIQGVLGAGGIGYAYARGSFQETLQQNLANAEQAVADLSYNEVQKQYNEDKNYKAWVDKQINSRAANITANQIAQLKRTEGNKLINKEAISKLAQQQATAEVLSNLVQQRTQENKSSNKYARLQQEAINGAGKAAITTFFPEAVKYGLVNTMGYRKYLYKPTGMTSKVSSSLKGLEEIATSEGRKRLVVDASKSLTSGSKWKNFGKTVASQAWGGAWTNGTDDMQVDAAERINNDSFNQYLDAYKSGKALANTYSFADGLYSYMMGLSNSMGQETTWKAAEVGAMGSILSVSPQFANIARLATKSGREAYKNNFWRETARNADGTAAKNEDGSIKYNNLNKFSNLGGQLNYLLTNGVLNTYYGNKQSVKDLQNHADYVNNILDNYDDFKAIERLAASDIASKNVLNLGDKKTIDFIQAINSLHALETLGNDKNDPATMSSVVQKAKALIEKSSHLTDAENNALNKEEVDNLIGQYYAANPGLAQSEENDLKAINDIASNAQKLIEASEAYDKAEEEIQKIEKYRGEPVDPDVRAQLKLQQALDGHWKERKQKMQSEVGDASSDETSTDVNTIIATVGGRKSAETLVKVYDQQKAEMEKDIEEQKKATEKANEEYQKAVEEENAAKEKEDSQAILDAQNKVKEAKAALEASQQREKFMENSLSISESKKNALRIAMKNANVDETNERVATAQETLDVVQKKLDEANEKKKEWTDENGSIKKGHNKQVITLNKQIQSLEEQKKLAQEELERSKDPILTADEIFALDPITRARMMREENRSQYSKEQQSEIEKLEQKLIMKDADALQKIQDIGLLTQRINQNADAYNRIAQNPEAAATEFENQRVVAADAAYKMIDYKNAEIAADALNEWIEGAKKDSSITEDTINQVVYKNLRKLNSAILGNIETEKMLPEYQKQLEDAKTWRGVIEDIGSVISQSNKSDGWKDNISRNIDNIIDSANTKKELLDTLEKAVDDLHGTEAEKDIDYILKGLEKLGYQRDATTLENRKQRIEREEKERKEREEKKKKVEEDAEKSAEDGKKKKIEEEKKKAEEKKNSIFEGTSAEVKVDMGKEISKESIKAIAETTGKTEEEVKRAIAELRTEHDKEKYEGWGAPSTALGNTADIIVRDFFAGELKDSYPNITKEVMQHFIKQLEDFRKDLDSKGIHIVSKEVMAHGVITVTDNDGKEHKLAVAGTLDLFGYDDKGNYYIFDMKTTRNHGEDKLSHEKAKWSRQVSMYADLLKQTYGIEIDPSRLQIIPINVYYPTPKGTEKYMNPTGPEYSVDEKTGQLKITDNSGKTTNFVQDKTKDFEMRSTKSSQFKPGYTKADINWDNLPSTVHDATEYNENLEIPEKVEAPKTPEEAVKKITEDTQKFTLSKDETYYYTLNKETGNEVRYPRVTTIISADRSIPAEQQWQPTNKEVIEKLTGKTSSEVADLFNKQEIDNAKPNHEVAKDGSNLIEAAPNDAVDKDASKSEQTGKIPGVWNAAIVMEDGFGDGSVNAGETHVVDDAGDAHKATFTVERKGDKVTFAVDKEGQVLDIAPNEYEKKDEQNNTESNVDKNSHIATRKREVVGRLNTYSIDVEDTPVKFEDLKNGDRFLDKYGYDYTFIKRTKDDKGNEVSLIKDYNGNTLIIGPSIPSSMILLEGNNSQFDRIVSNTNSNTNKVKESNKENGIFKATSIEKKDDGWYFNGNFEGENETTQVKVKDNFDLDAAIERQINATDAELLAKGIDIGNKNITDNGDSVSGHSLTVEEQSEGSNDLFSTDSTSNMDDANTTGNREIDIKSTTLSGNAMSRYVYDFLVGIKSKLNPKGLSKVLIKKKGAKENDSMNKYYTWMDAVGVKLQNIIDYELANILKLNPHAKVKFMLVTPKENATHDDYMQNHLMLVLDYDDSINKGITSIHNKENGGVIESNGKKYLIIGTAGYGNRNAAKFDLYKKLMDTGRKGGFELKVKRKKFFDEHPNERFYVNEDLSTEVEKNYPTPGYIIKQTEKDKGEEARNVRDILKDKERNPYDVKFDDVVWGILERSKLLLKGATIGEVMVPTDKDKNTGNVFVFMPASNGKLVPSPLKVLVYSEMKDGVLKNQIDGFLQDLTSLDYNTRLQAVIGLSKILYLDNKDKNILLRKNTNEVAFTYNGKVQRTFNLDNVTDRADLVESFKDALLEMNPIVNITSKVLESKNLLKQYEEAGALTTDAALFGTAGSNYSIYGIGEDGKMIVPSQPVNEAPDSSKKGSFSNNESQVIYNGQFYKKVNGTYYLKGEPVIDMKLIEQLDYNKRIIDGGFTPVENRGVWNYYILSEGEHPEVVKVNKNTKEVKVPTEEQAKELINKVKEKKEKEKRDKAAQKALDNMKKQEPTNLEDVPLDGTQDFIIDPETGELMNPETGEIISNPDNKEKEGKGNKTDEDKEVPLEGKHFEVLPKTTDGKKGNTQTFKDLYNKKKYKIKLGKLIYRKWSDAPKDTASLERFLKSKDIEVDNIGTSDEDIKAWIKTIEDCR